MKKNKATRIAAILLVGVLLTMSVVSGTFAKYVTSGSGSDSARVAKFGVSVTGTSGMFSTSYAKNDEHFTLNANSVVSSDTDKLVAPGTSQEMAHFKLKGTPEVATRVSYTVTEFSLSNWTITNDGSTEEYCPIVFTVNGESFSIADSADISTVAELEAAVKGEIEKYSKDYAANTDLSAQTAEDLVVTWSWPFSTSADNDVKDTKLGDAAAANSANAGKIEIAITATVTQID